MRTEHQIRETIVEILTELPAVDMVGEDDYIHYFNVAPVELDKELNEILDRMLADAKRLSDIQEICYGI